MNEKNKWGKKDKFNAAAILDLKMAFLSTV
jgi:hypothetical protein